MVKIKRFLDILCGIVALLSLGPIFGYLDRPLLAIVLLAIPVGYWCDHRENYPLPTWLATLIALVGMAFYAVQITRAEVAIPVVHAMMVLLAVRLVTPKEGRDYLQIFVLTLFILAGSSLIHLEVAFLVYLVLLVFAVTLGLVLLTVYVTDRKLAMTRPDLNKLVRIGLVLPAVSLLLMVFFFFLLPRTRYPIWNFLNPSAKGVVGLSETVQPGSFSQISTIQSLAFRAEGPELAPEDRYWRALVLNQFVEGRWVRKEPPREGSQRVESGTPVVFTIYPEPRTDRYLMTLDRPVLFSGLRSTQTVDQMFVARSAIDRRVRYELRASVGARLVVKDFVNTDFYLTLPEEIPPRMRQVADLVRDRSPDIDARLAALAEFFRGQQLSYAQEDLPSGPGAIEAFLFDEKRGYCEFFASAYVTLARLSGIPARLVGGYYGGDYNTFGGYYKVSEDTAHVWVEVLTGDHAWQRVDPSQWAVNASVALGERDRMQLSALTQLVDNINYQWVQAVVVFDFTQQMELFRAAGERLHGLRAPAVSGHFWFVAGGVCLGAGLVLGVYLARRKTREEKLLNSFKATLRKRYGDEAMLPGSGLAEIAEHLDSDACRQFARIYYGAIFRDRQLTAPEAAKLRELLKKI